MDQVLTNPSKNEIKEYLEINSDAIYTNVFDDGSKIVIEYKVPEKIEEGICTTCSINCPIKNIKPPYLKWKEKK
jgi:hypothetical protein